MTPPQKIAHLWRRAGFGGRAEELHRGIEAAVEELVGYQRTPAAASPPPMPKIPPGIHPTLLLLAESVRWWLQRMVQTDRPLEERLTLFWHRHFATSAAKIFSPGLMLAQNETLRRNAGGRFGELLKAVARDPAMIQWLDLQRNSADHPNENFARELLELYTTGPGHYSEQDIQAIARCFTGWRFNFPTFRFRFALDEHDPRPLRILGLQGQLEPDQVLDYLAVHPATTERMCRKLWDSFAGTPIPARELKRLKATWQGTHGNILAVIRQVFLSPAFYSDRALRAHVQSPLELYLASARLLELTPTLGDVQALFRMGELPMFPPSVKGWQEGTAWLHPTALLERFQLVLHLVERLPAEHPLLTVTQAIQGTPERRIRALVSQTGIEVGPATSGELQNHLDAPRRLLGLLLSSPEFQAA
ncbi:MAG: DUF1800 domain-containing protein [Armatimonadetes bacterium]|nr:DUF1800 domain-containing protein [Armatimonadota bacterium]